MRVGDIVFLEGPIAGLRYPSGYWAVCHLSDASMEIALVSQDSEGLFTIDNRYQVSAEDIHAFTPTGERARLHR